MRDDKNALIKDLHAGISRRDWHAVEVAANRLRDENFGQERMPEIEEKLDVQGLILSLDREKIADLIGSQKAPVNPLDIADDVISYVLKLAREPTVDVADWQPISEHKPKSPMHQILCGHSEKKWIRFGFYETILKRWYYSGTSERSQWAQVEGDAPTHFMPMPRAPE